MKFEYHVAVSIPVSIGLYLYLKSLTAAIGCFAVGVFVDIDHFPDYLAYCRFKGISLRAFFHACHNIKLKKLYLLFHSYEIVPVLFAAGYLTGWNDLMVGITAGFLLHLVADQISNRKKYACRRLFYFFTYRLLKGFRRELLVETPERTGN